LADDARDPIEVGDVIDGRFRVERVLGRGGMGVVVQAMHLQLQEYVAIKVLRAEAAKDEQSRARFLREARASARLRSEHVVRLMDFGLYERGSPAIVMEYLEGSDLGALLENGPLSVDDTVEYVLQATEGLAEAHALGLIHRDLKPGNLFVSSATDGSTLVKVLDFGVSKLAAQGDDSTLTAARTDAQLVLGSPGYMSPEQLSGGATDLRTDIWSLGVIVFECLTGELPFQGRSVPQVFSAILNDTPLAITVYREDVPKCLQNLVDTCLHKNASARCPDTASFASQLVQAAPTPQRLLRVERIVRLANVATGSASSLPSLNRHPQEGAAWSRQRRFRMTRGRWPWALGIGTAGLLAGVGLITFVQADRTRPDASTPVTANLAHAPLAASLPVASERQPAVSAPIDSPRATSGEPRMVAGVSSAKASGGTTSSTPSPRVPRHKPPPTTTTRTTPKKNPLDGWEPLEDLE